MQKVNTKLVKNAPSRARTYDPGVISTMLYRLSYRSSQGKREKVSVMMKAKEKQQKSED